MGCINHWHVSSSGIPRSCPSCGERMPPRWDGVVISAFDYSKNLTLKLHRLFVAGTQDDDAPDGSPGKGDQLREAIDDNDINLSHEERCALRWFSGDLFLVQYQPDEYTEAWALERLERKRKAISPCG